MSFIGSQARLSGGKKEKMSSMVTLRKSSEKSNKVLSSDINHVIVSKDFKIDASSDKLELSLTRRKEGPVSGVTSPQSNYINSTFRKS